MTCNPALLRLGRARRVLLLQGPVGAFFDRLATWLAGQGCEVHRIAFNPADVRDSRAVEPVPYTGASGEWPMYVRDFLRSRGIDAVVLFGQSRRHHAAALEAARELGVAAVVLEEGYVRPGFVTMELDGVNGLSRTLDRYAWRPSRRPPVQVRRPAPLRAGFWQMAVHACRYYWHLHTQPPLACDYRHHRTTDFWRHAAYWAWSCVRKQLHLPLDHLRARRLREQAYYFVPLQHEGDSQITHHSPYTHVLVFVREVLESFAAHAPRDALLVVKTHPHSRGGPAYERPLMETARRLGVQDRVVHLVEGHTPTLVRNARGVVLINSTVGVQALARNKPLAVLGQAVYRRPGLHFGGPLDRFWTSAWQPDPDLTQAFLRDMVALTQVPCHLYAAAGEPLPWTLRAFGGARSLQPSSPQ